MKDDYLWDRSGEPDPDVQQLEQILGRLRSNRPAPAMPEPASPHRARLPFFLPAAAAAALVAILAGAAWFATQVLFRAPSAWEVTRLAGSPVIGSAPVGGDSRLRVGDRLITDGSSRARIQVGRIGQVDVEPGTRLRMVEAHEKAQRLALEVGTIQARISAPPRFFLVDIPSAVAVDLGCAYTLQVDESGDGRIRVIAGWVAFEWEGHESFIPAGARCSTRPGRGPGTPYYDDASTALQSALASVDAVSSSDTTRSVALGVVLAEARPRDAFTLWHLLARLPEEDERARVHDRLAMLVPPPEGVTREGILRGDSQMLDLWWEKLGLRGASFWRRWKTAYPEPRGR